MALVALRVVGVGVAMIVMPDVVAQPHSTLLVYGCNCSFGEEFILWFLGTFFDLDTEFLISEFGGLQGKPAYKKDNGTNNYTSPSSVAAGMAGNNMNRQPPGNRLVLLESQIHYENFSTHPV